MSLTVPVEEIVAESHDSLLAVHPTWERVSLAQVATVLNGFAFKSRSFNPDRGMPLIRIRDVGTASTECLYDGDYEDRYVIRQGDLLIGMDGDFKAARWTGPPALLNQRVCKVELSTALYDPRFLEFALPGYVRAIKDRTSSQTVAHLSSRSILEIPLPLPPLAEQQRIVAKVEVLLERVNAARERLARVPAILKRFRQSVLAAACSGRLTGDWRSYKGIPSSTDDDSGLPATWKRRRLDEICERFQYGSSRKSEKEGEIPVLRMGNLQNGEIDWSDLAYTSDPDEIEQYRLEPNTVLFNRTNSPELVGKTAIYRGDRSAVFAGYLIRIHHGSEVSPEYLNYSLNAPEFREYCSNVRTDGVSQSNINAKKLAAYELPWCDIAEQHEIVGRVVALFKLADAIERRVAAATARAEKLTQAILAKAFRGELVPTEAELARRENRPYEPAAALLARIRAERAAHTAPPRKTGRRQPSDDARIALIARIIHRLHARPHFGTTQLAKALYLTQSHVGIDLAADFHRLAAGPLWKGIYPLRNRAKSQGYFDWTPPQGKGELERYQPGPNIAAPLQAGRTLLGDREPEFDRLLDLLGGLDTEQAEILATCYALWNDSLLDGRPPTDKQILREFRTNWHPKKKKFPPTRIQDCLNWMRRNALVPQGTGRQTLPEPA